MTTPFDAPDWRKLSRAELDRGLNNGEAVAGSGEIVAGWERQSADLRKRHAAHLDLRYGPRERNRIDFLKVHDDAPTLLFIHGGYWQNRAKENVHDVCRGPARLRHQCRADRLHARARCHARCRSSPRSMPASISSQRELPALGGDGKGLVVSGWSAGGHLTAMALSHPYVKAGMAISGIYDLEPIRASYLNVKLGLDEAMSRTQFADDDGRRPDEAAVAGGRFGRAAAAAQADRRLRRPSRQAWPAGDL